MHVYYFSSSNVSDDGVIHCEQLFVLGCIHHLLCHNFFEVGFQVKTLSYLRRRQVVSSTLRPLCRLYSLDRELGGLQGWSRH